MIKFTGTGVAVVTPFTKNNEIDFSSLKGIINHLINDGINYLVVLGSTGEAVTLSRNEKNKVQSFFVDVVNERVPLVLGVGGNNTASVVSEIKQMDFTGFDAVLSVSPSYNKPSQEGIYQHYKTIAENCPLPIILYNVPGRTGQNIAPNTVVRLANDFNNIIAIKEAAGDMVQILELLQNVPKDFLVISGDDMLALPLTLAGGAGVISVIAQGFPKDFSKMINLGLEGKPQEAFKIQYSLMDSINLIFEEGNPTGIKALLHQQNHCEDLLRLPLIKATESLNTRIKQFIKLYNS